MGASMKSAGLDQSQHVGVVRDTLASFLVPETFQQGMSLNIKSSSMLIGGIDTPGSIAHKKYKHIFRLSLICKHQADFF